MILCRSTSILDVRSRADCADTHLKTNPHRKLTICFYAAGHDPSTPNPPAGHSLITTGHLTELEPITNLSTWRLTDHHSCFLPAPRRWLLSSFLFASRPYDRAVPLRAITRTSFVFPATGLHQIQPSPARSFMPNGSRLEPGFLPVLPPPTNTFCYTQVRVSGIKSIGPSPASHQLSGGRFTTSLVFSGAPRYFPTRVRRLCAQ